MDKKKLKWLDRKTELIYVDNRPLKEWSVGKLSLIFKKVKNQWKDILFVMRYIPIEIEINYICVT